MESQEKKSPVYEFDQEEMDKLEEEMEEYEEFEDDNITVFW